MKLYCSGVDIVDYCQEITWSGDMHQPARTLKFTLPHPSVQPEVGDPVRFYIDSDSIFTGIVMFVDVSVDDLSVECMDRGIYLANNYTYKEYEGTPQSIAKQVCNEFGVKVGTLASVSDSTTVTSTGNMSAFSVIEEAYEGEGFTPNKQYVVRLENETLSIEKAGTSVVGTVTVEIEDSGYSQSIKNMVNRVVILDKEGKEKTDEVENAADRKKYGTFQKTYRTEEDKSPSTEARKTLKSIERKGYVTALGNLRCIAGKAVKVTDARTGLSGKYVIESDEHTFKGGIYESMRLDFYFEDGDETSSDRSTVRKGSSGDAVRTLQSLLNEKDGADLNVDGIFGTKTYNAVRKWQRDHTLTVDGIVGPKTWASLGE